MRIELNKLKIPFQQTSYESRTNPLNKVFTKVMEVKVVLSTMIFIVCIKVNLKQKLFNQFKIKSLLHQVNTYGYSFYQRVTKDDIQKALSTGGPRQETTTLHQKPQNEK